MDTDKKEVMTPEFELIESVKESDIKRMMNGLFKIISSDNPVKTLQELINNENLLKEVKERCFGQKDKNDIFESKPEPEKNNVVNEVYEHVSQQLSGLYAEVSALTRKIDLLQDDLLQMKIKYENKVAEKKKAEGGNYKDLNFLVEEICGLLGTTSIVPHSYINGQHVFYVESYISEGDKLHLQKLIKQHELNARIVYR